MGQKNIVNYLAIFTFCGTLMACSGGFTSGTITKATTNGSQACTTNCDNNNPPLLPNPPPSTIVPPQLDGKVSGGIWDGKSILELDWAQKDLLVKIPIDFDTPLIGGSFALPNHPEIVIEMVVDANNSPHLQFRLPLNKLLHGIDGLTEMGLPNGDPLPTTPRTLPHITAQIGGTSIHFYIGAGQVAVFVPTKFNPFITLIFPIRNKSQQILGGFGTIAKKGDHRGGFYASVELPEEFVKLIDSAL